LSCAIRFSRVAALVGFAHHLIVAQRPIVGDVEEVANLVEELGLAFLNDEVLA